jgi:Lon protease-like protein
MDELIPPSMPQTQVPLFPLQSVLFPGGYLPLRIFEVRYLDMIGRSHKADTPFGVVCLTEGREVRTPPLADRPAAQAFAAEAFYAEGTLATITHMERPNPGLMMIRCTGTQRFRVRSSEQLRTGLWVADIELLPGDASVGVPLDLQNVCKTLQDLLASLSERVTDAAELPLQPPYRWGDCSWLANRWCEILPLSAPEKQRFMTLDNPLVRLELVADALEQLGIGGKA